MVPSDPTIVRVEADFKTFRSAVNYQKTVEKLLALTPTGCLVGLDRVVLRDEAGLTRRQARRELKIGKALGYYNHATLGRKAWIEIFMDRLVTWYPLWQMRIGWLREMVLAQVFFHELGHHLSARIAPGVRDEEHTAEDWKKRLYYSYVRRRFWYLVPIRVPVRWVLKGLGTLSEMKILSGPRAKLQAESHKDTTPTRH